MAEARQDNVSHACGRSQENNYKIATWYTGNKQSFYFSTLKHLSSGDIKITLQNTHCADRKKIKGTWWKLGEQMEGDSGTPK